MNKKQKKEMGNAVRKKGELGEERNASLQRPQLDELSGPCESQAQTPALKQRLQF